MQELVPLVAWPDLSAAVKSCCFLRIEAVIAVLLEMKLSLRCPLVFAMHWLTCTTDKATLASICSKLHLTTLMSRLIPTPCHRIEREIPNWQISCKLARLKKLSAVATPIRISSLINESHFALSRPGFRCSTQCQANKVLDDALNTQLMCPKAKD